MRFLLVAVVKTATTIKHVDKALTSDSRITRGAGGAGGGGIALASSFSVLTGLVVVLAAVELFLARGLGAMEQTAQVNEEGDRYEATKVGAGLGDSKKRCDQM